MISERIFTIPSGLTRGKRAEYFKGVYGEDFPHDMFQETAARYFTEIVEKKGFR